MGAWVGGLERHAPWASWASHAFESAEPDSSLQDHGRARISGNHWGGCSSWRQEGAGHGRVRGRCPLQTGPLPAQMPALPRAPHAPPRDSQLPPLVGVGGGKTGKFRRVFPKPHCPRERDTETETKGERRRDTEREGAGRDGGSPRVGEVRREGEWSPGGRHHSAVQSSLTSASISRFCVRDRRATPGRCASGCRLTRGSLCPRRLGLRPEVCGLGFQGGQHRCSWAPGALPTLPSGQGRQGRVVCASAAQSLPDGEPLPAGPALSLSVLSLTRLLPGGQEGGCEWGSDRHYLALIHEKL